VSFSSLQEFLAMGGHALYVWLSYGAAVIVVVWNVVAVRIERARFFREARALARRQGGRPAAGTADQPVGSDPGEAGTGTAASDRMNV